MLLPEFTITHFTNLSEKKKSKRRNDRIDKDFNGDSTDNVAQQGFWQRKRYASN